MKMQRKHWIGIVLIMCLSHQGLAQPYYYYSDKYGHNIWRYDFQLETNTLFYTDSLNQGYRVTCDPTQSWVFFDCLKGNKCNGFIAIDIIKGSSPTFKHSFPEPSIDSTASNPSSFTQNGINRYRNQRTLDGIVFNPINNTLYVTWFNNSYSADTMSNINDFLSFQKTTSYNASSFSLLETLRIPAGWITSIGSVSDDGNFLYLENWDYYNPRQIGKYSLITKQVTNIRNISEIVTSGVTKEIQDSKKGYYLLEYIFPGSGLANKKYAVYKLDTDSAYAIISFPRVSHGFISSDGKFVIIEETPLKSNYKTAPEAFFHPGKISVFNGMTGRLLQKLSLPPDGKVLVFDNYPNMLYYYLPKKNRSINIDLSKLGPTACTVKLLSSIGSVLTNGTLQYRDSTWENATNNNDGTFTINTTKKRLSLRMTYEYGTQTKSNVTIKNDTAIVFQTKNVAVNLQTSQGTPLDTGVVQYNAAGPVGASWQNFGTTSNGAVTKELLPVKYTFRMTYNGAVVSKVQNIDSNATVVFQTVPANVRLQTSTGAPLDTGIVQFNAGGWKPFGTTTNGLATKELLPTKYNFRMTYNGATVSQAQNIDSNATVVFQTVRTLVQFNNSKGNPIDTGVVQFNSGGPIGAGWQNYGSTSNGIVSKELLPVKYTFRLTYCGSTVNIAQNMDSNATVAFSTVLCTVSVTNTAGSLLNNAAVSYNAGGTGWKVIGTTVNGIVTIELLPAKIQFRAAYGSKQQSLTQDVSANPSIAITLPVQ